MPKQHKIPLRIASAVRKKPKRELLRLVRTPGGEIVGGKCPAAAYICRQASCAKALKGKDWKNLEHPFRGGHRSNQRCQI